ncbi:MAG: sugar phosphate isomerase/epimerase family protein [Pirellulaceae bacterium]|jgi:sugar phosphate isomerase/epimerase|nr:sugar phosphate isomerase/epimerase family protein [Pirellulaceae bacterium]MDP7017450.1 sugar phosphate isomerase/epimerase family protein [Pirellulaceae bacterium]
MIRSAVTVSLVEEARGGPFVFWDGIPAACRSASELGYDAIEIFAPSPTAVDVDELNTLLERHGLTVAAVGTGAGMVKHGLSLTDPDAAKRQQARDFVRSMIDFGGPLGAPAIIGSMQGRWGGDLDRTATLGLLGEALQELGEHALQFQVPLIYEPLNRYETNLINTVADGVELLRGLATENVKLLADLFHMQIEEVDLAEAIRAGAGFIGHVHFVDSNRRAAGFGHMDFGPIAAALIETGYDGFASVEAFPLPDSATAASQTIKAFNECFRN